MSTSDRARPGRARWLAALTIFALLAGVACGGDSGNGQETTSPAPATSPSEGPTPSATGSTEEPSPTATPTGKGTGDAIELEAENLAFDVEEIAVLAGSEVVIEFHARDEDVPHNVAVYVTEDAPAVFTGDLVTNGDIVYTFTAPGETGTYLFRCDVHPTLMRGDLVVE